MPHLKLIKDNSILCSFAILNYRIRLQARLYLTSSLLASEHTDLTRNYQLLWSPVSILVNSSDWSAGTAGCLGMSWSVSSIKYRQTNRQTKVAIVCHLNSEPSSTAVLILTSYLATESSVRSVPIAVLNAVWVLQVVQAGNALAPLSTACINSF